ncbi:VOC family protein [Rhizobium sp. NZLR8]|uniref:VOC family protein n=2 Tax=Rhizobium TaxID=379 RepID=UPI001C82D202|nr:VOC family protein [Rhizobium sp. NZLR8]MBX5158935.1 VOC family protein [Rhizobium sp. NZLR8]
MGRLKEIVVDCDVPSRVARFWAAALDGYEVMPYDDDELARLAAIGLTPDTDPTVMVDGPGTRLCFHLRQGERPARNRVHLDIAADDREKEVKRLLSLGATLVRETDAYCVLNDPEGNNFCVTSDYLPWA